MTTGVTTTGIMQSGRRLAAWLGMVVVCFNLAAAWGVPLVVPLPAVSPGLVPVCTSAGMVLVAVEDDAFVPSEPSSGSLCHHCLPFLHGGGVFAPAAVALVFRATFAAQGTGPQGEELPRPHDPRHLFSARAPPGV